MGQIWYRVPTAVLCSVLVSQFSQAIMYVNSTSGFQFIEAEYIYPYTSPELIRRFYIDQQENICVVGEAGESATVHYIFSNTFLPYLNQGWGRVSETPS